MSSVTVPAFAVADVLSNLSAPPGSAVSLTVPPAAPPEVVGVLLVVAGAAGVADVLLLFLLLPQPAIASTATTARARWSRFGFIGPSSGGRVGVGPFRRYAFGAEGVRLLRMRSPRPAL